MRSELLLYSVSVHIFFPGTIYSPGYIEENKTKPKITLKIEETDDGMKPEKAAEALLKGTSENSCWTLTYFFSSGVRDGYFHISADLLGNLFRSSTRGSTPHNNVLKDGIYSLIGWVCVASHRSSRLLRSIFRLVFRSGVGGWIPLSGGTAQNMMTT